VVKLKEYPLSGNFRDLYRLAFQLIARRWWEIPEDQFSDAWLDGVLKRGEESHPCDDENDTWRCLSRGLSGVRGEFQKAFTNGTPIDLKAFMKWVQGVCACEVKEYAQISGRPIKAIVDSPTDESLRKWRENLD
jgi:hypothetical protein